MIKTKTSKKFSKITLLVSSNKCTTPYYKYKALTENPKSNSIKIINKNHYWT